MELGDLEEIFECDPEPEPFYEPLTIEDPDEAPVAVPVEK